MKFFLSVVKMLVVAALFSSAVGLLAIGIMSTGLALTIFMFVYGAAALVGGVWLTLYLLKRDAHFNMRIPLLVLIAVGVGVALLALNSVNWFKGF